MSFLTLLGSGFGGTLPLHFLGLLYISSYTHLYQEVYEFRWG
ncbi:hypothetical protein PL9214290616 [Planktothrix tepida PCC 9214]|uniref:Uncharacterized protein n=1 Tax=Planktothrix tepida PCC 9214 TaxID=671072 RepID=A0A1J1LHH6_9CYAN|nr:hypothetical protein PL9214290616 [Planktothrix tepida PCC 9214]